MLILAGISINLLFGDNGIVKKAIMAKEKYEISKIKEQIQTDLVEKELEKVEHDEKVTRNDIIGILSDYSENIIYEDPQDPTSKPIGIITIDGKHRIILEELERDDSLRRDIIRAIPVRSCGLLS